MEEGAEGRQRKTEIGITTFVTNALDIASWTGLLLILLLLLERIAKLSDPIRLDVRKRT